MNWSAAFVDFEQVGDADEAIAQMNGALPLVRVSPPPVHIPSKHGLCEVASPVFDTNQAFRYCRGGFSSAVQM